MTRFKTLLALTVAGAGMSLGSAAMADCESPRIPMGVYHDVGDTDQALDRVQISYLCLGDQVQYRVRIWGDCVPSACDWGNEIGWVTSSRIAFEVNRSFVHRDVLIERLGGDRIRLTIENDYTDSRPDSTWVSVLNL